jgi:hypothetical protein
MFLECGSSVGDFIFSLPALFTVSGCFVTVGRIERRNSHPWRLAFTVNF